MRGAIAVLAAVAWLCGCGIGVKDTIGATTGGYLIRVFHDDKRGVTCWTLGSRGGISCLPDVAFQSGEGK